MVIWHFNEDSRLLARSVVKLKNQWINMMVLGHNIFFQKVKFLVEKAL